MLNSFLELLDNSYQNIGQKLKNCAKWVCIIEAIGAIVGGIALILEAADIDTMPFVLGVLTITLGPIAAWISSWLLYAFGQLIDDTRAIRTHNEKLNTINENVQVLAQPMVEQAKAEARRQAVERAQREAERNARREADQRTALESTLKARAEASQKARAAAAQENSAEAVQSEKPQPQDEALAQKLDYALRFQSDEGMIGYLSTVQDKTVQAILRYPQPLIREQIQSLLASVSAPGSSDSANSPAPSAAVSRNRFCTKCGTPLAEGHRFCTGCGSAL